ncbi:hypothetical protein CBER1_00622 [Cercospora berteroae]|uniref:Uncharacterized protein n=1 Tax=Cercospora berteroae TaxID=357750 RepID=A0A2S6C9A9_9PEZI|nr:hypothetical protein CBER1_00622 [Cercospora berteroae]
MDQGATDKRSIAADESEVTADKSEGALDTAAEASTTSEEKAAEPDDQTSEKHFEFLELPPELRNAVYAAVLEDCSVTIPRSPGRPLKISSALIGVNKMIHNEFRSYATLETPVIRAEAPNLSFSTVITYLNRLEETQLKQLDQASNSKKSGFQTIKIQLTLTVADPRIAPFSQVNRWLNRFDVSTKRAAEIRFDYEAVLDAKLLVWTLSEALLDDAAYRELRSAEEAVKIATALQEAWRLGRTVIEIE